MRWTVCVGVCWMAGCGGNGPPSLPEGASWVFTTAGSTTGGLGGTPAANAICQAEATGAGLEGTFYAWITTSAVPADENIAGLGPWYLANTEQLAFADRDVFQDGPAVPLDVGPTGVPVSTDVTSVWTGADPTGAGSAFGSCRDWTREDDESRAGVGATFATDAGWTDQAEAGCDTVARLFCFGS